MRPVAREFVFALLAWLIPFAISVCIFPLKQAVPPLFESLMGAILALNTGVLGCLYLRRVELHVLSNSVKIGLIWVLANWGFDGLMFSSGPMKMSLDQYAMGIGIGYLMIPAITIALGVAVRNSARVSQQRAARGR